MMEKITFMQLEDNMVTFERETGETIIYPKALVPTCYEEGDIIKVNIYEEDFIEFIELDIEAMEARRQKILAKKLALKERIKNNCK